MTQYQKAWNEYTSTERYTSSVNVMAMAGMKQPYIDNILRSAFDAAWKDTRTFKIKKYYERQKKAS